MNEMTQSSDSSNLYKSIVPLDQFALIKDSQNPLATSKLAIKGSDQRRQTVKPLKKKVPTPGGALFQEGQKNNSDYAPPSKASGSFSRFSDAINTGGLIQNIKPRTEHGVIYDPILAYRVVTDKDNLDQIAKENNVDVKGLKFKVQLTLRYICSKNNHAPTDSAITNFLNHTDVWQRVLKEHISYHNLHFKGTEENLTINYFEALPFHKQKAVYEYLRKLMASKAGGSSDF